MRLRTNAAKRLHRADNALYLVFKIVERLSQRGRALNGGANLMPLVLEGCIFEDGIPKTGRRSTRYRSGLTMEGAGRNFHRIGDELPACYTPVQ